MTERWEMNRQIKQIHELVKFQACGFKSASLEGRSIRSVHRFPRISLSSSEVICSAVTSLEIARQIAGLLCHAIPTTPARLGNDGTKA